VNKDVALSGIDYLSSRYGKEAPLTVTRGKIHWYEWIRKDNLRVTAAKHGWWICHPSNKSSVNKDAEICDLSEAEIFHHYAAKMLFLCKHARPDIQMAFAFLNTRVKAPDQDDSKKLRHDEIR